MYPQNKKSDIEYIYTHDSEYFHVQISGYKCPYSVLTLCVALFVSADLHAHVQIVHVLIR